MIDADLEKAQRALDDLCRARTAPSNASLDILRQLREKTRNQGTRPQAIEDAQHHAFLVICELCEMLEKEHRCPDQLWDNATRLVKYWSSLLR